MLGGLIDNQGMKAPCVVATTADMTNSMTGLPLVDGYQTQINDRILVWLNTDETTNGIWSAQTGAWTRTEDFSDSSAVTAGTQVLVVGGNTYALTLFYLQESNITFGSTDITFGTFPTSSTPSVSTTFSTLALAQAAFISPTVRAIVILGYSAQGDGPPRTMVRISTPSPVQPWHVQTADGSYWQDSGGDFWCEWLGATAAAADCSTALNQAYLAHLNLGMVLRGKGIKNCTHQVYWNPNGFLTRFIDAEFNGPGDGNAEAFIIVFANNVTAPCWGLYASTAQGGEFYGRLKNIMIEGNTNGLLAQIGRTDIGDAMNKFDLSIIAKQNSTGSSAAALLVNGLYTSGDVYLQANLPSSNNPSSQVGAYALRMSRCNENTIKNAVSGAVGLQLENGCTGNTFSGEVALCYIGIQPLDNTCAYNRYIGGSFSNNTYDIDNHLSGQPIQISAVSDGSPTHTFFNPAATDLTWGGVGVLYDIPGWSYTTDWTAPTTPFPSTGTWVRNQSAIPYTVSIFGTAGSAFDVNLRAWSDASSSGATVTNALPAYVILGAGESIQVNYTGGSGYAWTWRPLGFT